MNITPKKPRYPLLAKVYYGGPKPGNWIGVIVACGFRREPKREVENDNGYIRVYTLVDPISITYSIQIVAERDMYRRIGRLTREEALTHNNALVREAAMTPKQRVAVHNNV